jgi:hypothetical protein
VKHRSTRLDCGSFIKHPKWAFKPCGRSFSLIKTAQSIDFQYITTQFNPKGIDRSLPIPSPETKIHRALQREHLQAAETIFSCPQMSMFSVG